MTCIAHIHHALRHVDAAAGNVAVGIDVRYAIDRAGVDTHSHRQAAFAQFPRQFQCAAGWCLYIAKEDKCRAVAGGQHNEVVFILEALVGGAARNSSL